MSQSSMQEMPQLLQEKNFWDMQISQDFLPMGYFFFKKTLSRKDGLIVIIKIPVLIC